MTRKAKPHPNAANLNLLLSILTRPQYSGNVTSSSDVIRSMMVVDASHKLTVDKDNGKAI